MIISEERIGSTIIYIDDTYVLTGEARREALDEWNVFTQYAVIRTIITKRREEKEE